MDDFYDNQKMAAQAAEQFPAIRLRLAELERRAKSAIIRDVMIMVFSVAGIILLSVLK